MEFGDNDIWLTEGNEFDIFTSSVKGMTTQITEPEESVTSTVGIDVTVHSRQVGTQYQNEDFQFPGLCAHFNPSIIRNSSGDWTTAMMQDQSSLGNVALLRNVMASPFLFSSIAPNEGRQGSHFEQQSFPDGFPIPILQNHSIRHTSQTSEQVRLDESKSKNDVESMGKGPIQLCFGQGNMNPDNVPYAGFSLQQQNRQQGEFIDFQSMNMNNNQLAPETPGKSKRLEGHHFTEVAHLADSRQIDGRKHEKFIVQNFKEHVEVSRCDAISQQSDCQSSGILQTQNIQREMGETPDATKMQVQKPRRKKHRPKVVVEGKLARKPRQPKPKPAETPDNPARKRGRRKKEESSMGSQPSGVEESSVKHSKTVRKSAKKHLDFDLEEFQLNDGNKESVPVSKCNTDPQDKNNVESRSDTNFPLDNLTQTSNPPFSITNPLGQVPHKYSDLQDQQGSNPPSLRKQILRENLKALARDRDKKESGNNLDSNRSSENQATYPPTPQIMKDQRSKRDRSHMKDNNEYNIGLEYQLNHVTFKKRRMENRQNTFASSTTPCTPSRGQNCLNELNATLSFADVQYHLRKLQDEKYVLSSDQTEQRTNQTPETPAKKIKFVFRADNTGYSQSPPGSNMPLVCYQTERSEILEASFQTTTPLKVPRRRTKKDSKTSFSQTGSGILLSTAMVPFVNVTYLTDLITLKLQHLNINGCSEVIAREGLQQENALVLYNSGGGAMVPFGGFFTPRKQRPRAKVDLDSETNRVWMLLMGKDTGNFGETDNDKEKWWQGEREVFRGRADSFIARMHLIQGDRRFSKWKGSVVDSVVGVFLTQNVSDHLSSSAFMAFAARYPNRSSDESTKACAAIVKFCTDNEVISVEEGCDHVVNLENQVNHPQSFNNEGSTVSHDAQYAEEKNMNLFNYSECRKTSDYIIDNTLKLSGGMKFLEVEDMRIQECTVSSQDSVVSSQQSSESPCQVADQIGLSLVSNIREDVTNNIWSNLLPHGSYTELLRMMGTKYPNEMYSSQGGSLASKEYSASEVVFSADHAKNRNLVLDEGPSMGKLNLEECYERHTPSGVSFVPLHSTPSHSNPESATSGVSLDKVKCPSEYNTTEFTGEVKSVFIDPSSSTIDRHFEPFPSSLDDSYCQSHLCNYNNISTEKDDSMVNEKSSISLSKHKEKFNVNSMEQEVRMNFSQGEEDNRKCEPCSSQTNFPSTLRFTENSSLEDKHKNTILETVASTMKEQQFQMGTIKEVSKTRAKTEKKQMEIFDWDSLRREACRDNVKKDRTADKMDAVDWEAIRHAPASEVAETIKYRGMSNVLAARIKDFLDRLVRDHGSIDLEWLRDVPPDKVKDYLLSIRGLGLKSVECVRLLTLEHLAFPVDTNVGRICVRLGWVPLQPLPESLQLHLLDMYPMLETIQKYLWPRLCTLDQRTLYELHYQLITFGKVFCTKTKPNCNSCPMRGECKHFASAFASARLALPGPEEKNLVTSDIPTRSDHGSEPVIIEKSPLQLEGNPESHGSSVKNCEPIVEEPATPEPEPVADVLECDIEDTFYEDPDEIPTIKLNIEQFTQNLQDILQETNELQDGDISKALVALTPEAASIPQPKLKNVSRLRTEHLVYELPDTHPLLAGMDQREPDDPCPYLLAMWTPGETAQSTECPETSCNSQCTGRMCDSNTCFSCNSIREAQAQKVRGTLLIPCRTAMRGSFPLNGTYFQVNEVFADHSSSINPIDVPRDWIWNLPRRTVYFGTSVTSIFRGLTTGGIQHCFWRGFVCVRGFDQKSRYPRPLLARLHFTANRDMKNKRTGIKNEE